MMMMTIIEGITDGGIDRQKWQRPFTKQGHPSGVGDELVNRSYRDRAANDLGHRDVTRNLSREL